MLWMSIEIYEDVGVYMHKYVNVYDYMFECVNVHGCILACLFNDFVCVLCV